MAKYKDTDYLFASSRIRTLEKGLLTRERVDRMLEARTLDECVKVLQECDYGLEQEAAAGGYEELLAQEQLKNLALLQSLAAGISPLFRNQYDYLNVKILLKAEFMGTEDAVLSPLGNIPVKKLKTALSERNFSELSPIMREAAARAIEAFGKTGDPQLIDLILDKACFEDIRQTAKETGNSFTQGYVTREIDLANLKTFVRLKRQGGKIELFRQAFIPGGQLEINRFLAHFGDDWDSLSQVLAFTEYKNILEDVLPLLVAGDLGAFEKALDDYRIAQLKKAKLIAFGLEPLVAFMAAKENDIKTARIILTGKAAGLPSERIAEKVRETYV